MDFIKKLFGNKKLLAIIALVIFALVFFIGGFVNQQKEKKKQEENQKWIDEQLEEVRGSKDNVSDNMLLNMQPDLIKSYGKLPDGYIWDIDGTLLSKGDINLSAEEVVYAYLNGLRTLDMSMVQKYSRGSVVMNTYEGYFNESNKNTDYTDQFMRNMYRESLLSMEIKGIDNSSVFAEDKQVFTVTVNMLDLTNKSFWEEDRIDIYKTLDIYSSEEADSAKSDIYLYDYILQYYKSDDAVKRDVQFDLTVQRYPDLETGWLVSIDTDVDLACRYADGKLVVSYIKDMYIKEGLDILEEIKESEAEALVNEEKANAGAENAENSEDTTEVTEE